MEIESIEKVRQYALQKFCEISDGEFELPKYQSMAMSPAIPIAKSTL